MKSKRAVPHATLAIALCVGSACSAATMTFDSVGIGTSFGIGQGHIPGQGVFSQDGIDMSVENFYFNAYIGFFKADVGELYDDFFDTRRLEINNINVRFTFGALEADLVTLEFMEFGGVNNFSVNDAELFELASLNLLDGTTVAAGVTATIGNGLITLNGPITSVTIGGQEMAVDTIVAIPEPATVCLLGVGGALLLRSKRRRST